MTTLNQKQSLTSETTTTISSSPFENIQNTRAFETSTAAILLFSEYTQETTNTTENLDDFISDLCKEIPGFSDEMQEATKWVANTLYDEKAISLAKLRMEKGLSQRELAKIIGTSQSQLSRLESGAQDPSLSTIENITSALGVELIEVVNAIRGSKK